MNIVQLHDKVLGYLDQARSGRIHPVMIDAAANAAHVGMLNQKIGSDINPGSFYPEESIRIKDQLKYYYTPVVLDTTFPLTVKRINLPSKLSSLEKPAIFLLLDLEINIGSKGTPIWKIPSPVNSKERQIIPENTFLTPKSGNWFTSYFIYSGGNIELFLPDNTDVCQIRVGYLKFPSTLNFGQIIRPTDTITPGNAIVSSPKAIYDTLTQFRGTEFNLANSSLFTTGEVYMGYTPADVDPQSIDLISSMAASIISGMRMGILNQGKEN